MATTTSATNPDMPVHIKIGVNGKDETRKFKLALKDLGASTLPQKLRELLQIQDNQDAVFERYSDSSASFVTLDSSNPSIYKQLYRAAKAKGKLRLRVSISDKPDIKPEEAKKSESIPDRLSSRRYVHPYVSDVNNQETSNTPRTLTMADLQKLCEPQAGSTATASTIAPKKNDVEPLLSEKTRTSKPYFWPVTGNPEWSEATKSVFDKATKQDTQESLRKIKEAIAARATHTNIPSVKLNQDEAPVPRFFSAREQCRAEHNGSQHQKPVPRACHHAFRPCASFTICCNNCDGAIPDEHWHCSICDNGDFDLCLNCVQRGYLCDNDQHWLIKRNVANGKVVNSTTETIAPKKITKVDVEKEVPGAFEKEETTQECEDLTRTCNSCVQVFDESQFVTCQVCDDYDLCIPCHVAQKHGHHPSHGFAPATAKTILTNVATALLGAGRNTHHWAICDGCDKDIYGVRHKCLKCPDWDYCAKCIKESKVTHPGHRFVPLYEPITNVCHSSQKHDGIFCDGPLCIGKKSFIRGDRYKCAVCHDTDFCANCEALPRLPHNRTHPLLKFRTPVRNVSVSTYGGKEDGSPMMALGDQLPQTSSKSTETNAPAPSANAATQVQTVAECKPFKTNSQDQKVASTKPADLAAELNAHFIRDTVADGTQMVAGAQFVQTWTLRNPGPHTWPAGCCVTFIGGDAMLDVDTSQPSHVTHIRKATKSNTIERPVSQGEEADFTVVMRAPEREGNAISYWRLKGPDGTPFGHKLWCDIFMKKTGENAKQVEVETESKDEPEVEAEAEQRESQMIFPKLDKESPIPSDTEKDVSSAADEPLAHKAEKSSVSESESAGILDEDDESSDEGFLTDEEYELIASGDEMEEAKNGKK